MSYEGKSSVKWISVALVVAVLATAAVAIWNVRIRKADNLPTTTISQKVTAATSSSPTPAEGVVSQVPRLVPGDTCERATELYGKPTEKDEYGGTWATADVKAFVGANSKCVITGIDVEVKAGHRAITSDGIKLGLDTVADVERILQSRIKADSESVEAPEGNWDAMISVGPTPDFPYKTTYRAKLDSKKVDRMNRDPSFDDFRGQVVTEYSLEQAAPTPSSK